MGRDSRMRKLGLVTRGQTDVARTPKVIVGYPCGGSVTVPFHASLMNLQYHELRKPKAARLLWEHEEDGQVRAGFFHCMGLYVADNRNTLARRFLDSTDADWLLQIDTDIEFPATLIESMVSFGRGDRKVIAANVPLGSYPTVAFNRSDKPGIWECLQVMPANIVECDAVATAILLTHRSVFEVIAKARGRTWFNHIYLLSPPEGADRSAQESTSIGEDVAFCIRAQECGFGIFAARVPGLRHHKTRALSEDFERGGHRISTDAMGQMVQEG